MKEALTPETQEHLTEFSDLVNQIFRSAETPAKCDQYRDEIHCMLKELAEEARENIRNQA